MTAIICAGTPERHARARQAQLLQASVMPDTCAPDSSLLVSTVLRQADWATGCQAATLQAFAKGGVVRHLKRGEVVMRRGAPVRHLGIVVSGALQVGIHASSGKRMITGYLGSGQLFNLVPFLDGGVATNDLIAHTDLTICVLNKSLVEMALSSDVILLRAFMQVLCLRARRSLSDHADLLLVTLRQRCAKVLLNLAADYGSPHSEGVSLTLRMSQAEFADLVGWSRPKVNQELKRIEAESIIQVSYSRVLILDMERLKAAASGE
ncbi:Crp/Fnr family transcriptional regulator [Cupriavidus sp. H39]|uniref:Crp/Fnr family transcriptional regulator n=1 Tax=Cupriavidus sp. H39 TaxID=3401635 RepID=UPI003D0734FB